MEPSKRENAGKLLVRLTIAFVFVSSGLVKLVYENQGVVRFAKLGLAGWLATFVSVVEITAGLAMILGLAVRWAGMALVADMLVAIAVSKAPLLFGPGPEPLAAPPKIGLAAFAYQARLDVTMLVLAAVIVIVGAGNWSLDERLRRQRAGTA